MREVVARTREDSTGYGGGDGGHKKVWIFASGAEPSFRLRRPMDLRPEGIECARVKSVWWIKNEMDTGPGKRVMEELETR